MKAWGSSMRISRLLAEVTGVEVHSIRDLTTVLTKEEMGGSGGAEFPCSEGVETAAGWGHWEEFQVPGG